MPGKYTTEQKTYYALRLASAMCFIGHGAFGIITKAIWCNYFAVFGIGHDLAYQLMPAVGVIDILFGLTLLFYPLRAIVAWLVVWAFITATLRPLSGEPFAELIERAGNFGAPLALLLLTGGPGKRSDLFKPVVAPAVLDDKTLKQLTTTLRVVVFLLLTGHGWLNLLDKKGLIAQYSSLGFSNPATVAQTIGLFEIIAGFSVLLRPIRPILLGLFAWKIASELFYPHYAVFEWIERGGSYFSLLALFFITGNSTADEKQLLLT